jgi:GNAT superfamily N-acetyltransferase
VAPRAEIAWRIEPARFPADGRAVRALFEEYARSLDVSLCFQGFDRELATLPGDYAPPRGGVWLARASDAPVACVALRPLGAASAFTPHPAGRAQSHARRDLEDDPAAEPAAELKRLYGAPQARGAGLGRRLAATALEHARAAGYRRVKLDTLRGMNEARRLYASLGFVPCAPYYPNPLAGVLYFERTL